MNDYKIAVFGLGRVYKRLEEKLSQFDIRIFMDNHPDDFPDEMNVLHPENVDYEKIDVVLITSVHFEEMREQLIHLGVHKEIIFSYKDIGHLSYEQDKENRRSIYKNLTDKIEKLKKKKILLVTDEMSFTGATTMLYYLNLILIKKGYIIVVMSRKKDAGMEKYFREAGSFIIYENYFAEENSFLLDFFELFDCIWINTMTFQEIIPLISKQADRTVWWIHESDSRCDSLKDDDFISSIPKGIKIYGVGPRVINSLNTVFNGKIEVNNLLYGIPDKGQKRKNSNTKLVFAVIGAIYEVKGQDIFVQVAEDLLNSEIGTKLEFWCIRPSIQEDEYYENVMEADRKGIIRYLGVLDREEMDKIYSKIDVLVLPSRRDSMAAVVAEAMMNYKPCIVSDITGNAYYIVDGENGYIFKSEDTKSLEEKICFLVDNWNLAENVGINARKTYEENFSIDAFENRIDNILNDLWSPKEYV